MKIKVVLGEGTNIYTVPGDGERTDTHVVDTCLDVELSEVYNGIGIKTDQGYFGVCMRDDGLEVLLDGALVWSSTTALGNAPVSDEVKRAAWKHC